MPPAKKQRVNPASPTLTTPTKKSNLKSTPKNGKGKEKAQVVEEVAPTVSKQFITASSGDAYLLSHSGSVKTSDSLLSEEFSTAFTLPNYHATLREFDSLDSPELILMRDELAGRGDEIEVGFERWLFELEEGFSIFLWGMGCKRLILNDFVDECRTKGEVVMVEEGGELVDLLSALEELLEAVKKGKGKGKMVEKVVKVVTGGVDGRVRRFCEKLDVEGKHEIFIVVHGLDSSYLKKHLDVLVLLAAQPKLHLIASLDHIRSGLLFPTTTGFKLLFHEASTLLPFTKNDTLSRLLPPSIFPEANNTSSSATSSLAQSTTYVLASVPDKAKKLFTLLSTLQLDLSSELPLATLRALQLSPPIHLPAPIVAILLSTLKSKAIEQMFVSSDEQVDTLLGEFMDHSVVRKSVVGPVGAEETGEWVWIPLNVEELEGVRQSLE